MKKVILSVAIALMATTGAFAQKQDGGEKSLEVNFAPLGGNPIGMDGIRLRLFNADGSGAIRIGLGLGGSKDVTVRSQAVEVSNNVTIPELYDTKASFNFSIRPGYEMHFEGTDRLSPYVGAELLFAMGSDKLTKEFHNASSADNVSKPETWSTWEAERTRATSTFGLNAIAGVDYYIADHLYLGAEIGFGYQSKKYKDQELSVNETSYVYSTGEKGAQADTDFNQWVKIDTANNNKVTIKTPVGDGTGKYKNSGWGPTYQATIRLGWLF